jgi:hypothetical protein
MFAAADFRIQGATNNHEINETAQFGQSNLYYEAFANALHDVIPSKVGHLYERTMVSKPRDMGSCAIVAEPRCHLPTYREQRP